jgi:hypothetical protein
MLLDPPPEPFSAGTEPIVYGLAFLGVDVGVLVLDATNIQEAIRRSVRRRSETPLSAADEAMIQREADAILSYFGRVAADGTLGATALAHQAAARLSDAERLQLLHSAAGWWWLRVDSVGRTAQMQLNQEPDKFLKIVRHWRVPKKRGAKPKAPPEEQEIMRVLRAVESVRPYLKEFRKRYGSNPTEEVGAWEYRQRLREDIVEKLMPGSASSVAKHEKALFDRRSRPGEMLAYLVARHRLARGLSARQIRRILRANGQSKSGRSPRSEKPKRRTR